MAAPHSPRRRRFSAAWLAAPVVLAAAVLLAPERALAQRQSGIQLGLDETTVMVSKDVNGERWAISYDSGFGFLQGNVFPQDGSAPKFIWCDDTGEGDDVTLQLDCYLADPCNQSPCGSDGNQWTSLGVLPLEVSFVTLPGESPLSSASRRPRK